MSAPLPFPQAVEAEEELDFAGADDGADALHGGLAAGALERVGAPDAEDEVAPERAHGAGGGFGFSSINDLSRMALR